MIRRAGGLQPRRPSEGGAGAAELRPGPDGGARRRRRRRRSPRSRRQPDQAAARRRRGVEAEGARSSSPTSRARSSTTPTARTTRSARPRSSGNEPCSRAGCASSPRSTPTGSRPRSRPRTSPGPCTASNPGYSQTPDAAIVSIDNANGAIRTMLSGRNYQRGPARPRDGRAAARLGVQALHAGGRVRGGDPAGAGVLGHVAVLLAGVDERGPLREQRRARQGRLREPARRPPPTRRTSCSHSSRWTSARRRSPRRRAKMGIDPDHLSAVPSITLGTSSTSRRWRWRRGTRRSRTAAGTARPSPSPGWRSQRDGNGALYRHKPDCKQVIDKDIATQVTSMLEGVVTHAGRHRHAGGDRPAGRRQDRHHAGVLERVVRRATPRRSRPRSGWGSPAIPTRSTTTSASRCSAARSRRRSGTRTCRT